MPTEAIGMDAWVEGEIRACKFPDERLGKRLGKLLEALSKGIGQRRTDSWTIRV